MSGAAVFAAPAFYGIIRAAEGEKIKPRLYILAGANGSGKSTISKVLLPSEGLIYVNPDDIAKELRPDNPSAAKIEAGKETLRRIASMFERCESFAIESTLSGSVYVKVIERAKSLGYDVIIAYIFVDSPDVCIRRIEARIRNGGHFVPAEDVVRRYSRSKYNFVSLYRGMANHWLLYYNGGTDFSLVAHGNGDTNIILKERYEAFMEGICRK